MNLTRNILRATVLLLFVLQLIYLYRAGNSFKEIVKFKYEALKKATDDSMRTEQRFDSLTDKTKKFSQEILQESPYLKKGIRNLIAIVALLAVMEVIFAITKQKK